MVKTDTACNGKAVVPGSTIGVHGHRCERGTGAGTAVVTDTLPTNVTYVSGSAKCATTTGTNTCTVSVTGSKVTIKVTLGAGQSVPVTLTATVKATDATSVKNTAKITTGPCNTTKAGCTSTVTNPVPDFTVVKTDTAGNGKAVVPGSTIGYTVTVANVGTGAGTAG